MTDVAPEPGATTEGAEAVVEPAEATGGAEEYDYSRWDVKSAVDRLRETREEAKAHRLRAEAAEQRAARFKSFESLDDNDLGVFSNWATQYAQGDFASLSTALAEQAKSLTPAERGEAAEAAGLTSDDRPLTIKEFNTLLAERETQREQSLAQAEMDREATELGAPPGSDRYWQIMHRAFDMTEGGTKPVDLAAAAKAIDDERAAERQKVIDDYLAEQTNKARAYPGSLSTGAAPSEAQPAEVGGLKGAFARGRARADDMLRDAI